MSEHVPVSAFEVPASVEAFHVALMQLSMEYSSDPRLEVERLVTTSPNAVMLVVNITGNSSAASSLYKHVIGMVPQEIDTSEGMTRRELGDGRIRYVKRLFYYEKRITY